MIHSPPSAIGCVNERGMPFRPPLFLTAVSVNQRIARAVFPWSVYRFGASYHRHVAGGCPCSTALCIQKIVIFANLLHLRTFKCHAFHRPMLWDRPAIIHFLQLSSYRQPVIRQFHPMPTAKKQPPLASTLIHYMTRVYPVPNLQVHRFTPRPLR